MQTNILLKASFNVWCFSVYDYSLCLQLAEMVNLHFLSLMEALRECNSSVLAKLYPMWTSILFTYHSQVKLWKRKIKIKLPSKSFTQTSSFVGNCITCTVYLYFQPVSKLYPSPCKWLQYTFRYYSFQVYLVWQNMSLEQCCVNCYT